MKRCFVAFLGLPLTGCSSLLATVQSAWDGQHGPPPIDPQKPYRRKAFGHDRIQPLPYAAQRCENCDVLNPSP